MNIITEAAVRSSICQKNMLQISEKTLTSLGKSMTGKIIQKKRGREAWKGPFT